MTMRTMTPMQYPLSSNPFAALAPYIGAISPAPPPGLYGTSIAEQILNMMAQMRNASGLARRVQPSGAPRWQFKNGSTATVEEGQEVVPFYSAWDRSLGCRVFYAR